MNGRRPGHGGVADGNSASDRHLFATIADEHVTMLDIGMDRTPSYALVRAAGTIRSTDEGATFLGALEFVPDDDDLVIDLSQLEALTPGFASSLRDCLLQRAVSSEAVVISAGHCLTRQLVLGRVDRVVPIVAGLQQATDVIGSRRRVDAAPDRAGVEAGVDVIR